MTSYIKYREHKILRYLDSLRNGWRTFPPSLQIGLTDYCFNKCVMCGHWKRKNKSRLDFHQLITFLEYGKCHGLETVCYSGGDPFMYPLLHDLMEWHVNNGIKFGFITAGYFDGNTVLDYSLLSKAEWVRCSLDAVDPIMYKVSRGGIPCVDVIQSIKLMVEKGVNVCLGITIHRLNELGIKDVLDFATPLKIPEIRVWVVRNADTLEISDKGRIRVISLLRQYRDFFDAVSVRNNFNETLEVLRGKKEQMLFNYCSACRLQSFIDAKGDVYPCCILAGDTESSANWPSLGNMNDTAWSVINERAIEFSNVPFDSLPEICRRNCILRLSTINHFAERYWEEQNFI